MSVEQIAQEYDRIAESLGLYPSFYEFITQKFLSYHLPATSSIVDVGCGRAQLLSSLVEHGYHALHGIELSPRIAGLARNQLPAAEIWVHDITAKPLKGRFQIAFMTEVVEHLVNPVAGLRNVYESLCDEGWLFLSFPNRLAFFPWYLLQPVVDKLRRWPDWHQRAQWLALPYEMRSLQPIDHSYAPQEVADFLRRAGFHIIQYDGMRLLPMLRIPGWDWTNNTVATLERVSRNFIPKFLYYRYVFVCRK